MQRPPADSEPHRRSTQPEAAHSPPETPSAQETKKGAAKGPRAIGGRRHRQNQSPSSRSNDSAGRPDFAPFAPWPELICREAAGSQQWEVLLSAAKSDVAEVRHRTRPLASEDGEWRPPSLWGWLSVTLENGEQRHLSLFEHAKPLIFKLGNNWTGVGRKVGAVSSGHYIIITPNTWRRKGQSPVDPQGCVGGDFTAHYFLAHAAEQTETELGGFEEYQVVLASACINLDGDRVFDGAERCPLFAGAVPKLCAADSVVWARVGEERDGGWKGENFRPHHRSLSEVLQRREGRFFLRVYDAAGKLLDSVEFRYCAALREINVNGEPYSPDTLLVPTASGHRPTTVRLLGADGATLAPTLPNATSHAIVRDGAIVVEPHPDVDDLNCVLESGAGRIDIVIKLPRIWWSTAGADGARDEWRDTPLVMTRQDFSERANADMAIRMRLPPNISTVKVGFDDEQDRTYDTVIPLQDFVDYTQIDQRLRRDALLIARCGNEALPLVRVSADPAPVSPRSSSNRRRPSRGNLRRYAGWTRNAEPAMPQSSFDVVEELWRSVRQGVWSVLIVLGDRAGHVGYGIGTGTMLIDARRKSRAIARESVVRVPRRGSTIPCPVDGRFRNTYVSLEPAPSGTGIDAVGAGINAVLAVRTVMHHAGVWDMKCRLNGSAEAPNVVRAVFDALKKLPAQCGASRRRRTVVGAKATKAEGAGLARPMSPE